MMTGVALDHEDKLDDILKGLEDLNRSSSLKKKDKKKNKEEDDVFDDAVSFVTTAVKWKGRASTSKLEQERAKIGSSTKSGSKSTSGGSFKTAANVATAAKAFGKTTRSPLGSTSSDDKSGSKKTGKLGRTSSEKVKKHAYKTAENKDGSMTRTYSQKYKA